MDNLEKTIVLNSSDEESTIKLDSSNIVCSCSNCDSSNYTTACSKLNLSFFQLSCENSNNEMLKRSISSSSFDEFCNKRQKSSLNTSSQVLKDFSIQKKSIFCDQLWTQDERLSKDYYYNRIDDSDFEANIFVKSLIERTIDLLITGKFKFALEHYYQLEKKRVQVIKNENLCQEIRENLNSFIKFNESNTTDLIWIEMQTQTSKRRLEDQLQITSISEEEFVSFSDFLQEIYQKFELLD